MLSGSLEYLLSREEIRDRMKASQLTWKKVYDLIFQATGDEDLADKEAAKFQAELVRRGEKVEDG